MTPSISGTSSEEESQPFLTEDTEGAIRLEDKEAQPSKKSVGVTPLTKAQLASLCAVRLVDPIAFTQIFPYVNEMMEFLHVTENHSRIGFYSGLVVSGIQQYQRRSICDLNDLHRKVASLSLNFSPSITGPAFQVRSAVINSKVPGYLVTSRNHSRYSRAKARRLSWDCRYSSKYPTPRGVSFTLGCLGCSMPR